jgi:hypothetical protein
MNIFEINNSTLTKVNEYYYIIDNFYKYPNEVNNFFKQNAPYVHKWIEINSKNCKDFLDLRHYLFNLNFIKTEKKIYEIFNRNTEHAKGMIMTNFTKFNNIKDNYKYNYWWPHSDPGAFTCLIYLNNPSCDGTNIYERLEENQGTEHSNPWQDKKKFNLITNIPSKYNRLIAFKSSMCHGLAYNNHQFKNNFRKNQVIFVR